MRCPKCGFISFDNLDTCKKCGKDLSGLEDSLGGGLAFAEAPSFLVTTSQPQASKPSFDSDEGIAINEDYLDHDFDSLFVDHEDTDTPEESREIEYKEENEEDNSPLISFNDSEDDADDGFEIRFSSDDDDAELSIDFGEDELALDEFSAEDKPIISMPEALNDISDLSPEGVLTFSDHEDPFSMDGDEDEEIDLDSLDLELDSVMTAQEEEGEGAHGPLFGVNKDGSVNMDSDLDFELDLGGLQLFPKKEKEMV